MIDLLKAVSPYASAILFILQGICALFVLAFASKFVLRTDHDETVKRIDGNHSGLAKRVEATEGVLASLAREVKYLKDAMADMPNAKDIHDLSIQITKLQGSLDAAAVRFESQKGITERLQKQVDVIDEYLRERGK